MSINQDRKVIRYNNIFPLMSESPCWVQDNNEYSNLKPLSHVQSLEFSFDIPRENVAGIGSKSLVSKPITRSPDVNVSFRSYETFGSLFSGMFDNEGLRTGFNDSYNFYNIISDKQEDDGSRAEFHDHDCISIGNSYPTNISMTQGNNGLLESTYNYVGSNIVASKVSSPRYGLDDHIESFLVTVPSQSFSRRVSKIGTFNGAAYFGDDLNEFFVYYEVTNWAVGFFGSSTWTIPGDIYIGGDAPIYIEEYGWAGAAILSDFRYNRHLVDSACISIEEPSQPQSVSGVLSSVTGYAEDVTGKLVPHYNTSVTISGQDASGCFFVQPDSLQSFDLSIDLERKTIYSLGKKFPIARKALYPIVGSLSFEVLNSTIETTGVMAKLHEYTSQDIDYTITLQLTNNEGVNIFQFNNVKLDSQSTNLSIGRNQISQIAFEFDSEDLVRNPASAPIYRSSTGGVIYQPNGVDRYLQPTS